MRVRDKKERLPWWWIAGIIGIGVLVSMAIGLAVGARPIGGLAIVKSFWAYDATSADDVIVQSVRVPRVLVAALCGSGLAVAGALMQGITNNPMASPSIMGINAGASLGLAVAMIALPEATMAMMVLCTIGGALLATTIIIGLARTKGAGASPVFLALAGAAVSAMTMAVTQALVVYYDVAQDMSYWTAGGIGGVRTTQLAWLWPWTLVGMMIALWLAGRITLLSFGDEVAIGLGGQLRKIRVWAAVSVLILSGAAVAVAGPVGFVGLITPHIARRLVGIDYRHIIPTAALLGALLLVTADIVARTVAAPFEIPLGAVTALLGVPFFLYLANRKGERL